MSTDFLGNTWPSKCMGCTINSNEIIVPGGIICKTRYYSVLQDPFVPLSGFLVINSHRHIQCITEMTKEEYEEYSSLFLITKIVLRKIYPETKFTVIQEDSSQHYHTWFFPWNPEVISDHKCKPYLSDIRKIMSEYIGKKLPTTRWLNLKSELDKIKLQFHQHLFNFSKGNYDN